MQTVFKAEFFNLEFSFIASSAISSPEIAYDYLTLETTEIILPSLMNIPHGAYANITDVDGNTIYQGIVLEAMQESETTSVLILPLLSICDVVCFTDLASINTIEELLAGALANLYAGDDSSQNITGFSVVTSTLTGASLLLDGNINNLYDIMLLALRKYNVAVSAQIDPQAKTFVVTIGQNSRNPFVVETDLPNIISSNFTIGSTTGSLNKITYVNQEDETETATYFLHIDGTITTIDADRITPVRFEYRYLSGGDDFFAAVAVAAAEDLLPDEFNNLIEIVVKNDDQLVIPSSRGIGDRAILYRNGDIYSGILTGSIKTVETTTLVFGSIRLELTKKLIMDKRDLRKTDGVTIHTISDSTYVHNQVAASAAWTINHNLNKFPSVAVVNTAGTVFIGDVDYVGANSLIVSFSGGFSGKAYLN